ncbi:hypothetical protein GIB67_000461 [Kingdonia uniflora]|uniref:Uncharacterized protein n=1 Tax=Kingdonia uniflora TaxID=39325 RepID=A0A7J7L0E0_9MAGN|nr:hypothetical protein GIB67_000461 [Kingdonia uniflora]
MVGMVSPGAQSYPAKKDMVGILFPGAESSLARKDMVGILIPGAQSYPVRSIIHLIPTLFLHSYSSSLIYNSSSLSVNVFLTLLHVIAFLRQSAPTFTSSGQEANKRAGQCSNIENANTSRKSSSQAVAQNGITGNKIPDQFVRDTTLS